MAIYNWYYISPLCSRQSRNSQKLSFRGQFELSLSYVHFKCMIWVYNLCRIGRVIDYYDINCYRGPHVSAGAKISVKLRKISICMVKHSSNYLAKTYLLIPSYDFFQTWFFGKPMVRLCSDFMATDLQHEQASRLTCTMIPLWHRMSSLDNQMTAEGTVGHLLVLNLKTNQFFLSAYVCTRPTIVYDGVRRWFGHNKMPFSWGKNPVKNFRCDNCHFS
jgi:hypothetical protein